MVSGTADVSRVKLDASLRTNNLQGVAEIGPQAAVEHKRNAVRELQKPRRHHIDVVVLRREQHMNRGRLRLRFKDEARGAYRIAADVVNRASAPVLAETDVLFIACAVEGKRVMNTPDIADFAGTCDGFSTLLPYMDP